MTYSAKAHMLDPLYPVIAFGHILDCIYADRFDLANQSLADIKLLFGDSFLYPFVQAVNALVKNDYAQAAKAYKEALGGFVGTEATLSDRPTINPVSGRPSSTTLSGDINNDGTLAGNSRIVMDNSGLNATAILNGFVIAGGNSVTNGGAMVNYSSNPVLTNCCFISNSASNGGAMANENSSPTLTNCNFQNNTTLGLGG